MRSPIYRHDDLDIEDYLHPNWTIFLLLLIVIISVWRL